MSKQKNSLRLPRNPEYDFDRDAGYYHSRPYDRPWAQFIGLEGAVPGAESEAWDIEETNAWYRTHVPGDITREGPGWEFWSGDVSSWPEPQSNDWLNNPELDREMRAYNGADIDTWHKPTRFVGRYRSQQ